MEMSKGVFGDQVLDGLVGQRQVVDEMLERSEFGSAELAETRVGLQREHGHKVGSKVVQSEVDDHPMSGFSRFRTQVAVEHLGKALRSLALKK